MMTSIPAYVALSYHSVFVRANPQECIRISRQGYYEVLGEKNGMLMVSVSGTAVIVE
jgi:hypothetical protein